MNRIKLIHTLYNDFQTSGSHQITWNGEGLPSGIYFILIESSKSKKVQKVVLQK